MSDNPETIEAATLNFVELTADIVAAYISNNRVPVGELPALIAATHAVLAGLGEGTTASAPAVEKLTPAQIRKSVTPDALISFEDGKPYKTLRRHLTLRSLSAEAYREKWGLPRDYPMTAASYSAHRSELAKSLGLGQLRGRPVTPEPAPVAEPSKKRGRKKVAEAGATE